MGRSTINMQDNALTAKMQRARRFQLNLDHSRDDKSQAYLRKCRTNDRFFDAYGTKLKVDDLRKAESNSLAAGGIVTNSAVAGSKLSSTRTVTTYRLARVVEFGPKTARIGRPLKTKCRDQFCSCRGYTPLGAA